MTHPKPPNTPPNAPPNSAAHQPPFQRSVGGQFAWLVGAFVLLFVATVAWLALDQRALLDQTHTLQTTVIEQSLDQQRLARNLEQLRLEGNRMLLSGDANIRDQAHFVVSAISNHPRMLGHADAAALSQEVEAFLMRATKNAPTPPSPDTLAQWRDWGARLSLLADRISVDGVNLGSTELGAMELRVRRVGRNLALALLVAGLFAVALLVLMRHHLVRPLQRIRVALGQLQASQPVTTRALPRTAEFQAIEQAMTALQQALAHRAQTESRLQQQAQQLLEMGRTAKVGAWSLDRDTQLLQWTGEPLLQTSVPESGKAGNGNERKEAHLDALLQCIAPSHRPAVRAAFALALSHATPFDLEVPLASDNPRAQWVHLMGHPQPAPQPLRGTAQDITEHKHAQAKLQLAASVFTHARDGVVITDARGTIIDVNDSFTRITGYEAHSVKGNTPRMLASGRHTPAFYADMWHTLEHTGHWSGEIWNRRKNGEVYVEMLTISAVPGLDKPSTRYVGLFSDITSQKEHQSRLEAIAHFDTLTGLPNRLLLADRLQQGLAQTNRHGGLLAVAYLDLDGFKAVNDTHGHGVGDQLLIAVSAHMRQALRESDTLARIGGDEFVAVLPALVDEGAGEHLLQRLLAAASQPVELPDLSLQVSASIGVTYYPQATPVDADLLLRQADQAMYQAKTHGRNRCCVFDRPASDPAAA